MSGLVRVVEMMQRVVGPNQRRKDGVSTAEEAESSRVGQASQAASSQAGETP